MTLYEGLYGKRCRTPSWEEVGDKKTNWAKIGIGYLRKDKDNKI